MQQIAELISANPAGVAAIIGALVAFIVQVYKRVARVPSGAATWEKMAAAIVSALVLSYAAQAATGSIDVSQLITVALGAWLASAGLHGTQKALQRGSK